MPVSLRATRPQHRTFRAADSTTAECKVRRVRIGVAKEIKPQEYRVALTPAGARELVQHGHEVVVETSAGAGSQFTDDQYEANGARIASVDEVWESAELLLKVKEPIAPEYPRLRPGLVLFTYLHIAADEPLTRALVDSGVTGCRLRDRRDRRPPAAAAGADERGRGPACRPGGRALPRAAERRPRPAARRRRRRRARQGRRHRRRHRRLQRRRDRARPRRAGDHPRALGRPDAPPRGDAARPRQPRHVLDAADRGVGAGGGRRHRRRPDPGRAGAEAAHTGDGQGDEAGERLLRRRDRPGRLRRDVTRDDARRSRSTRSTASSTTASPTCRARCRSRRPWRSRT